VNDTIEQAKAALVKALQDELDALTPRIKGFQAQLDAMYETQAELVLQIHQVTGQKMAEIAGPVEERSQAAWRARNVAICRLFLTTDMTARELAKRYGVTSPTIGLILYHAGIPGDRSFSSYMSRNRREDPNFGKRRARLPADVLALIDKLKADTS
jgi:hypothetical protein